MLIVESAWRRLPSWGSAFPGRRFATEVAPEAPTALRYVPLPLATQDWKSRYCERGGRGSEHRTFNFEHPPSPRLWSDKSNGEGRADRVKSAESRACFD